MLRSLAKRIPPLYWLVGLCRYLSFRRKLHLEDRAHAKAGSLLPPPMLRYRVHGALDESSYGSTGKLIARIIFDAIARQTGSAGALEVLDFACGPGRVATELKKLAPGFRITGTDIDREAIAWASTRLAHVGCFLPNAPMPPTTFPKSRFDVVYSISLFTHLDEGSQHEWLQEIARILKPQGLFLTTIHGRLASATCTDDELRQLDEAGIAYRVDRTGTFKLDGLPDFYQTTFHTREYIERVWTGYFDVVACVEGGLHGHQDLVILKPKGTATMQHAEKGEKVSFTCNVCGGRNRSALLGAVENRECPSCLHCKSSLRMRSLMYLLSLELHGKPLILPRFPRNKKVRGLGMSDWDGYAIALAHKLDYVNTYYHAAPQLDITNIDAERADKSDFLISSDVFEHIPLFDLDRAFRNCRRLLKDGGFLLFTVPFRKHGETVEHFPRLHDFRIVERHGKRVLVNLTVDGEEEVFEDLVFHGGDGMTLEMRVFSETDLRRRLQDAGFSSVDVCSGRYPEFGVLWPTGFDVPIIARA